MQRNRWVVAAGGTVAMTCLGTVYSWSVFTQPLMASFAWSNTETTAAFALAILSLGVGAVLGGRWQDRSGPRVVAVTGLALWGLGNVLAGLGTARLGLAWLYVTYGVIGGLGNGLGYVTPVAAVTKWFPDRRGLGSGVVVMGFGLGAFLYSNVVKAAPGFAAASREAAQVLAARASGQVAARLSSGGTAAVLQAMLISGLVFGVVGGLCAMMVRDPPEGYTRPGAIAAAAAAGRQFTPAEAMRTPQFWMLWLMLFLNVTAGILFISNAVPIMRELTGASPATALGIYGVIALFNGVGRLFWGAVSDRIGRCWSYILVYGTQVLIFSLVGGVHALPLVTFLFAIVLLDYGGGFGIMPSFVADYFGTRSLGVLYGWVLLAWGAGGVAGPIFVALVKDHTGSFAGALPWIAALLLVAGVLPVVARRPGLAVGDAVGRWAHLRLPRRAGLR